MSRILLDTLKEDLDPQLVEYLNSDPQLQRSSEQYLQELLINDDLLSTEIYTTVSTNSDNHGKHKKTLIEEIAELDQQQRQINIKLSSITNENRDLIIDISNDLSNIDQKLTTDYNQEIESMLITLRIDKGTGKSAKYDVSFSEKLSNALQINNSILSSIDSVLDLLELPTLCKLCILQGNYQESLEISILVQALTIRFPKLTLFQKIHDQIEQELRLMVKGLIKLLNTNLKQNNILKIFQILNKLDLVNYNSISNSSSTIKSSDKQLQKDKFLKIIYLNARFKFIINELSNLKPLIKFSKLTYLKRFIEIYREFLFSSLSIYYAIFNSTTSLSSNATEDDDNLWIHQFIKSLAFLLSRELTKYLPELFNSEDVEDIDHLDNQSQKDGLILQVIYLCKSLAKYNVDFESVITWELCYKNGALITEEDWLRNLAKVKKFRT